MPTPPNYPTIPVPTAEPAALLDCVIALKQAVELLTGQATDQDKYAIHMFVQSEVPEALHVGDLWLCTSKTYTFNIWNGEKWLKLSAAITPFESQETFDFKPFMKAARR